MEENNEKQPDAIISKSGKEFKTVKSAESKAKENVENRGKGNFCRNVFVPFVCGVLGAGIVVGTCFGVPSIRDIIVGGKYQSSTTSSTSLDSGILNPTQISLENYSDTGMAVASKVLPSIVGITVEYPVNSIFMNQSTTTTGSGSGIIISEDGYILTNNHVINSTSTSASSYYSIGEATKVSVYLYNDKTEYVAKVIGSDEETDLAVIKIEKTGLTAATLGESSSVKVGEFAMAIGNPLGMQSSVTSGIISAVNREITDSDGKIYTLIQTDAAINAGNSGGALVNSKGEIIGVNTLKVSQTGVEGMGFAIPIDSAKPIYKDLIEYNKVRRPYIGISGRELSADVAKANKLVEGIYVVTVSEYSAAEKAGVKAGDVVIKADGKTVKTMNELNAIKAEHGIGDEMKITIYRDGQEKELTLKLTEQP